MAITHEVWAKPSRRKKKERFGSYTPERWQWAVKHAAFLVDLGYLEVELRKAEDEPKPAGKGKR